MMDEKELLRLKSLYKFEQECISKKKKLICGLDEAGRGPLAGPVVSSAVVLPLLYSSEDFETFEYVKDSKKLSQKRREKIYKLLLEHPDVYIGVGIVSEKVIDRINILKATQMSMRQAICNLGMKPDNLLVDGMVLPEVKYPQKKIINGDNRSLSIAAASIVAKVTRDGIMRQYHEKYPLYGFDKHKGYGTKAHMANLKKYGLCKIHRRSFRPINLMAEIGYV